MMIIEKITECAVVQEFDTEVGDFVRQHCIAGGECVYSANRELENGELSEDSNLTDEEADIVQMKYLPYDMVQPGDEEKLINCKEEAVKCDNFLRSIKETLDDVWNNKARYLHIHKLVEEIDKALKIRKNRQEEG